jgi:hypothetical protein
VRCCTFRLYSPAGSAAAQERGCTACRVSRFPPSAARRDRRSEVACRGFDLTLLPMSARLGDEVDPLCSHTHRQDEGLPRWLDILATEERSLGISQVMNTHWLR